MPCPDCDGTGFVLVIRGGQEAAARCARCRPKKPAEARTPIDDDTLIEQTEILFGVLKFSPEGRARDVLAAKIRRMCGTKEALAWVVDKAISLHTKWDRCGMPGLRQILIKKFEPADGLNLPAFSEEYPDAAEFDRLLGGTGEAYAAPALPDGATPAQIEARRKTIDNGAQGLASVFSEAEVREITTRAAAKPWALKPEPLMTRDERERIEREIAETKAKQEANLARRNPEE